MATDPDGPIPERTLISVIVPRELKEWARQLAARRRTTLSKMMRQLLAEERRRLGED